jgi:predicted outer membrane repeat protein
MRSFHGVLRVWFALVATLSLGAGYARAATYTVTNTNDDLNPGSLRYAIAQANASPGSNVSFKIPSDPATISLSQGSLQISGNVNIVGPGAHRIAINGNGSQIFSVSSATNAIVNVTISGLTLQGASNSGSGTGGAIYAGNYVALTLRDIVFTGNSAYEGGAIWAGYFGTVTVSHCTFASNSAQGFGGAIFSGAPLSISNSTFSGNSANWGGAIYDAAYGSTQPSPGTIDTAQFTQNSATGGGGAIYAIAPLTITGALFSGNTAQDGGAMYESYTSLALSFVNVSKNTASQTGGGIDAEGSNVSIVTSTISGNSAGAYGGGIQNTGTLALGDSTVSGNTAQVDGGGISNFDGFATLSNDTIAGNTAAAIGGGIYSNQDLQLSFTTFSGNSASSGATAGGAVYSQDFQLGLRNTIFANSGAGGNCYLNSLPAVQDQGYNLSDDSSCTVFLTASTDKNKTPAGLSPAGLQNNGGPTQTIALLHSSPAVRAVPMLSCVDFEQMLVATDQRGMMRLDPTQRCDIGAYQFNRDRDWDRR